MTGINSTASIQSASGSEPLTLNTEWLATWLQREHLATGTLTACKAAFASHPARLVFIRNALPPQVADRLNHFLEKEAEFRPEYGLYSVEGSVGEQDWQLADEQERFFRLRKLVSTPPQFQMSPNALTYLLFRKAFQRPD